VSRGRDESGKYTAQTGPEQVLQVLREQPDPVVTATEIAEHLDVSAETARRYLSDLHENGEVRRKQVGARAVVWWLSDETDAPATPLTSLVGMLDEDAVKQAERRSGEWREQFDEEMG
jgi:predicted ArsR family transcriptional regulator